MCLRGITAPATERVSCASEAAQHSVITVSVTVDTIGRFMVIQIHSEPTAPAAGFWLTLRLSHCVEPDASAYSNVGFDVENARLLFHLEFKHRSHCFGMQVTRKQVR